MNEINHQRQGGKDGRHPTPERGAKTEDAAPQAGKATAAHPPLTEETIGHPEGVTRAVVPGATHHFLAYGEQLSPKFPEYFFRGVICVTKECIGLRQFTSYAFARAKAYPCPLAH